jgi:calcineurin-like phosphoesterase family protein
MTEVFFVSDLHLGHRTILQHSERVGRPRGGGWHDRPTTVGEHDEWVIDSCLSVSPTKRTLWWLLGDIAMERDRLPLLDRLPGRKMLILGNHDLFQTGVYLKYVEAIRGGLKKYKCWLSHIPVHPDELRGLPNIHGHCHQHTLRDDSRYLNTAIEWLPEQRPISLDEVRTHMAGHA